ncbi:MAG: hypothetical protein LBO02_00945, partial [Holosporaceae bacterium]|nr:hypothetical protein [Holosporaceae bacterium]
KRAKKKKNKIKRKKKRSNDSISAAEDGFDENGDEYSEKNGKKKSRKKRKKGFRAKAKKDVSEMNEDEDMTFAEDDAPKKKIKSKKKKRKSKNKETKMFQDGDRKKGKKFKKRKKAKKIETSQEEWKDEIASNLRDDEAKILDPIVDSSQIERSKIKIETRPTAIFARNIGMKKLDNVSQSLESTIDCNIDKKIEKIFEKTNKDQENSIAMTNPSPTQPKRGQRKIVKEGVNFRQELEKYRQLYARSSDAGNGYLEYVPWSERSSV